MPPNVFGYGTELVLSPKINLSQEEFGETDGWTPLVIVKDARL